MYECLECGFSQLDTLSLYELIEEVERRIGKTITFNPTFGLLDQQKQEIWEEVRDKYTIHELQERLK